MSEEITVYYQDAETYLKPEEYQAFLKAKEEVDEYNKRRDEYEINKAVNERLKDECQKHRDEADNDVIRLFWEAHAMLSGLKATMPAPYKPTDYFVEHDHYIDLVRKAKLKQIKEEERRRAEEEAERQREEERKKREQEMMVIATRRKMAADSEWQQFQKTLTSAIKDLKAQLANPKPFKIDFGCSPEVFKYCPQSWCDLELLPSYEEVEAWAKPQILAKIPEVLRPFVTWELASEILAIPKIKYELVGAPSLSWNFDIYVKAKVDLWLKESVISKEFHGWKYVAPIKTQKVGSLFLGADYWDSEEGFTMPIALLTMLGKEKLEDDGIEVMEHEGSSLSFSVRGYDEGSTEVDERFRQFIMDVTRDKSLAQGLLGKGLINEVTAQLVEEKAKLPLPQVVGAQASAGETSVDNSDVLGALQSMGFKTAESKKAIEAAHLPPGMSTEEKVKSVVKILGA
jgi:hypothetical protein